MLAVDQFLRKSDPSKLARGLRANVRDELPEPIEDLQAEFDEALFGEQSLARRRMTEAEVRYHGLLV